MTYVCRTGSYGTFSLFSISNIFDDQLSKNYANPVKFQVNLAGFFIINPESYKGVLHIPPDGSFTYSPGEGTYTDMYFFIRGDVVILHQVIDYKSCARICTPNANSFRCCNSETYKYSYCLNRNSS